MTQKVIRVLVIDDSALVRDVLTRIIEKDPSLEVVGTAADPIEGWRMIKALKPDVLTLDVEMPKMDGLAFLEKLMSHAPMPVVMVSSLTERGCATTLRALELGAIDFVTKPAFDQAAGLLGLAQELSAKLKVAAWAKPHARRAPAANTPVKRALSLDKSTDRVLAIGASTGGTEALAELLTSLPPDAPGIVIVQHMPPVFTAAFAKRLDAMCSVQVAEARHGDRVIAGRALIAPGGRHMEIKRSGGIYVVEITDAPPVNRHKPSVDVLFKSCAKYVGPNAVGVIMTGMGDDGARGLVEMRKAGARTIAQDEATCVVFGMPREAIAMGGACEVQPLNRIAATALRHAKAA